MAQSSGLSHVAADVASCALDMLGIDSLGLTASDRAYLAVLCERVGMPYGVTAIAAQLGLERGVIEGVIEPWLMETGLIRRTPQGRMAMPSAVAHLQAQHQYELHDEDIELIDTKELS